MMKQFLLRKAIGVNKASHMLYMGQLRLNTMSATDGLSNILVASISVGDIALVLW